MTAPPPPPLKTDAGQDELRRRTRKLGQRHRTVLFLVDGKRSRDEVVALALQAGVAASFFDELVTMGLVEFSAPAAPADEAPVTPPESEAAPAEPGPAPDPDEPAEFADLVVTVVADEPALAPPPPPPPAAPPARRAKPAAAPAPAEPLPSAPAVFDAGPVSRPAPLAADPASVRPARVKFTPPSYKPPAPTRRTPAAVLAPARPPRKAASAAATKAAPAPPPAARSAEAEDALLSEVRGLLIGTLLVDGPVSSSLLALKVGRARSRSELVALVWEIERNLVRAKLPREGQGRLMKARDLLALGNTQVQEDTEPGRDTE